MTTSRDADPRRARRWRSLWVVACLLFAALVAAAIRTEHHVEHDPRFCATTCHHSASPSTDGRALHAGFAATGHDAVECQSCHATTPRAALRLYWDSIVGANPPVAHGKPSAQTCAQCHEKQPAAWRLVAETQGHRTHRGVKDVTCLSCHANGVHVTEAPEVACAKCHKDEKLHKATTAGAETCLSCHSFAVSEKNAAAPTTVACQKCHASAAALDASTPAAVPRAMRSVDDHALHGGVACQLCHNAHGKKLTPPKGQPICARCHQLESLQAAGQDLRGPEEHRKCVGCHEPHAPRKTALETCVNCHEKNAKGLTSIGLEKTTALRHESCASCHVPHTWRAERSGCVQCHKAEAELVLTRSPEQHSACTSCHDIHGPRPTGAVCLKCHSDTMGRHVALAPDRHKDCTSCHNAHAPRPADTRTSCAKCHATEVRQVTVEGPEEHANAGCMGCHKPHENPVAARGVCATCHVEQGKNVATALPPKHRTCASCHEKHVFRVTEIKSTCATCHGPMFTNAAGEPKEVPHNGDCKSCHTVHGPPGVPQAACLKCHAKVEQQWNPPNAQHGLCRSCHQPHTPASTAVARCAACHADKAKIATKWPPGSAHAQACNVCHEQHDVRVKKPCTECHGREATGAMGSKHQCAQCHAPHSEPPGTGRAWWSRCAECHAKKVEAVKGRGPIHSECKNCHQEHRFAIPTCTTCHTNMAAKGLHASPKHAVSCTSCHDAHTKSEPSPAQCRACHTDRASHEPNAKRCQACHLFQ